jgi:signal transduction histidine kinase
MTTVDSPHSIPRRPPHAWPVLLALGIVAFLLLMMVVADLTVARRVASRTSEMIDDEQRSIELVDEMREEAERMASLALGEAELVAAVQHIARHAQAYEPLTSQPGEREEWRRLRADLADLESSVRSQDAVAISARIARIRSSVRQLAVINRDAARDQAKAIRAIHRQAMVVDALVGLLALALVAAIVVFILRVLARQRALTDAHINLLAERNRELDAFAERAAHDLRAPLSPIRGYADFLMTGRETPESVQRMSRAGRLAHGTASLAKVATEVLQELRPQLLEADVTLSFTDEVVACAPSVLAQLLRNLITNSVKFQSKQHPLKLVLSNVSSPKDVDLILEDNGIGMTDEDLAHAFEPYYRGSENLEVPGHGLGLAIVQKTMTALGGTCRLSHSPLGGTAVTLRLARASSEPRGGHPSATSNPPPTKPSSETAHTSLITSAPFGALHAREPNCPYCLHASTPSPDQE